MRDGDLATPENAKNFVQALFSPSATTSTRSAATA
jgi:hypothetical protein